LPPDSLAYPRGQLTRVTQSSSEVEQTAKPLPGLQTAQLSPTFTAGHFLGMIGVREFTRVLAVNSMISCSTRARSCASQSRSVWKIAISLWAAACASSSPFSWLGDLSEEVIPNTFVRITMGSCRSGPGASRRLGRWRVISGGGETSGDQRYFNRVPDSAYDQSGRGILWRSTRCS
jgi:hypothetical protein